MLITAIVNCAPMLDSTARERISLEDEKLEYEVETLRHFAPSDALNKINQVKTRRQSRALDDMIGR